MSASGVYLAEDRALLYRREALLMQLVELIIFRFIHLQVRAGKLEYADAKRRT